MVKVRQHLGRQGTSGRGAIALELALILPLLLLVSLACIDFGRFPTTSIAVRNAARVGAQFVRETIYPVLPPNPDQNPVPATADVTAAQELWKTRLGSAVRDELIKLGGYSRDRVTLNLTVEDPGVGQPHPERVPYRVKVEVSYRFEPLVTVYGLVWPDNNHFGQPVGVKPYESGDETHHQGDRLLPGQLNLSHLVVMDLPKVGVGVPPSLNNIPIPPDPLPADAEYSVLYPAIAD